ncbi:DUF1826 domain-containing protein [Lamprobacter modestohalophilus]|uniref:DUF1826 domain-containing protein n=1 Tax=Lamprobacter modestohalophilus TaxID=1064514 RepID=UPI002ADEE8B9|nr:DUF1826 domain-containing protein [Lamprobacter modestohalophilus]MEA1053236.1 DUF1826 domain-containing protein [Lamprobacter modestohalophilus]
MPETVVTLPLNAQLFQPTHDIGAEPPHTRVVPELADLVDVFIETTQVCLFERSPTPEIERYLANLDQRSWRGFRLVTSAPTAQMPSSTWPLPICEGDDNDRAALANDLAFLAELYADLLGCPALGVRMERLDQAMCPRWHRDRTGVRLLCTYRGPGTEWIEDRRLDGLNLREEATQSCPASGCAEAFDIVLLKGSAWPGNAKRGAIHRSPAPDTKGRYLLAMDALWDV